MNDFVEPRKIYAVATDPIYVGTGGYAIGRVDNTIVRDPTTNIPKIPGSSLAGTWRYYMALKLQSYFKNEYKADRSKRAEKRITSPICLIMLLDGLPILNITDLRL